MRILIIKNGVLWMKKLVKTTVALAAVITLGTGNIAIAGEAGTGPSPYVDCGIGGALFPDTHWAAISSNVIWDAGTTAITSATASPETCSGKEVAVAEFIGRTYDNLIEETAQGEGQHVSALLDIYNCSSNVRAAIVADIRSNVATDISSKEFSSKTQLQKGELFYNQVNSVIEGQYSNSCSA